MKKFVLTILAIVFAASPVLAEDIGVYGDQAGLDCNITDTAGLKEIFLLLKHNNGATAVKFILNQDPGITFSYLSETVVPGFLAIGNAMTGNGIEVAFPCQVGDVYFMKISFFASGTSTACSYFSILPAANSPLPGEVVIVDCASPFGNILAVPGGQAIVNPNGTCPCDVAASEATWGAIKALYR